jgi:hypothetical protein
MTLAERLLCCQHNSRVGPAALYLRKDSPSVLHRTDGSAEVAYESSTKAALELRLKRPAIELLPFSNELKTCNPWLSLW